MKQKLKDLYYKIIHHLFPIQLESFQDFFTAARLQNYICTVKIIVTPCFSSEPICNLLDNTTTSFFYSIELRGKKFNSFDIYFKSETKYYSLFDNPDSINDFYKMKEYYEFALASFDLLDKNNEQ